MTVLAVLVSAYIDNEHLIDGDYIENHTSRYIMRALFVIAIGATDIMQSIGSALIFMSMFDTTLNYLRFKSFKVYFGSIALWDVFWTAHPVLYRITMIIAFITGITATLV